MNLALSHGEAIALAEALDNYLPQLAENASHIERGWDAHEVWATYRALEAIRARLSTGAATDAGLADV